MANVIACTTGNAGTSTTWAAVDSTSELDAIVNTNTTSSSSKDSSTFTPGAITTDGVALNFAAINNAGAGTFTVTLRNSTGSVDVDTVTVNNADLPFCDFNVGDEQCWVFFKFATSHTLIAATNYLIRVSSSSTTATLWRDSTTNNWSRKLRTTTTQALGAQNHFLVCNELTGAGTKNNITVTWDLTSLLSLGPSTVGASAGSISGGGTVTWGVTASTNYYMQWRGVLWITGGGTMNNGTTGSRVPASSTHTLKMDCSGNNDSKLRVGSCGNWKVYGAAKTSWTRLTADAASSATSLTVGDNTGWQAGDTLAFSPTGSSHTQYETKVIASTSGSTSVTLSTGLTNAHSGTSPLAGYVLNMNRNVKILSGSTSLKGNIFMPTQGGNAANTGGIYAECLEIDPGTMGSNATNCRVVEIGPTQAATSSVTLKYVAFNPSTSGAGSNINLILFISNFNNTDHITIDRCVCYDWACSFLYCSRGGSQYSPTDLTITNNVQLKQSDGNGSYVINCTPNSGFNFNNNVSISHSGGGPAFDITSLVSTVSLMGWLPANFDGNEAWHSDSYGFQWGSGDGGILQVQNCKAIRNGTSGWNMQNANPSRLISFKNCEFLGNTGNNGQHADLRFAGSFVPWKLILDGCTFSGDTTVSSSQGIVGPSSDAPYRWVIEMYNTTFGKATGIRNAYTNANIACWDTTFWKGLLEIIAVNCYFGGSSYTGGGVHGVQGILDNYQRSAGDHVDRGASYMRCQDYNQTAGDHRTFAPQGTVSIDTTVYHTASPSQKLTPNTASYKMRSGVQQCSVASGVNRTVSVWVRRSKASTGDAADYNGAHPRLMIRRNDTIGVATDTVLATGSSAIGNWEQISGTVTSPTEDGAIEVYVDCDGTTGFVNVDDYSIS